MPPKQALAGDAARGLLLLGVVHIHALDATVRFFGDGRNAALALLQIKLLAPHVVLFFVFAGQSARELHAKRWPTVLQRSLSLVLLAWLAHAGAVVLQYLLWTPWPDPAELLMTLARPLLVGSGHWTMVPWFLVVLAVVRLFAYAATRGLAAFCAVLALAAALAAGAKLAGLSDSFYEWPRWPVALVMFAIGMHLPPRWRPSSGLALASLFGGLALALVNRPALWRDGICLACDPTFVAHPTLGELGFFPVYAAQEAMAVVFVVWLSQRLIGTRAGALLAWAGRQALPLLVLHVWMIMSVYGLASWILPRDAGPWILIAIAAANFALHLALLRLLATPMNRFVRACSSASHRLVARFRPRASMAR